MNTNKNNHKKKIITAIVITAIIIFYFILYFGVLIVSMKSVVLKWLLGIIPAILGVGMIYVCVQRIHEIKGGEEDDLGQY